MGTLNGKVALVTGGVSGIGGAITRELAERGCHVAYHYFRSHPEDMVAALSKTKIDSLAIQGDLTNETTARRIVQKTVDHFHRLDILVNNTGDLVERHSLEEMDLAFFHKVMAINLDSMMLVTRFALPHLSSATDGAAVVNMASLAGRKGGHVGSMAYSTAKGAVLTFTRSLAAEVASVGIRANAIAPGLILGTHFHDTHTTKESARYTIEHQIPLGRAGTPADVARAVAYLASEYDGFITGATLDINGGQYMM